VKEDIRHINRLIDVEDKSVLEVGCGSGRITFPLAKKALEIIAIDIDKVAVEEARKRNRCENVEFLVENIETVQLGRKFDVIFSTWLGYMYLDNVPKAVKNISDHLADDGVFLLLCGSVEDEFTKVMDLLLDGRNIKNISFYIELERLLCKYFSFEKHVLKGQLVFPGVKDIIQRFRLELKNDYGVIMDNRHEQRLRDYLKSKGELVIGYDSVAYLSKKNVHGLVSL
jgi:SAM-dependent methyltransferase